MLQGTALVGGNPYHQGRENNECLDSSSQSAHLNMSDFVVNPIRKKVLISSSPTALALAKWAARMWRELRGAVARTTCCTCFVEQFAFCRFQAFTKCQCTATFGPRQFKLRPKALYVLQKGSARWMHTVLLRIAASEPQRQKLYFRRASAALYDPAAPVLPGNR